MTERDKKLLAIFAAVVILGGYWFLVLGKKRAAVADAQEAKASAQQQLDAAIASESQGKVEVKKYPVKYSRVLRMGKAIPVDSDFASLLVQISDIAGDSSVDFESLTSSDGASSQGGTSGPTGTTVCEAKAAEGASGASGEAPAAGATGGTGTVATPAPAESGVGQQINKAKAGQDTANNDGKRAADSNADFAARCASSPTLTDLTAVSSGLQLFTYNLTFAGSFYDLHSVFDGILGMVNAKNGKVSVTGRLLQINNFSIAVKSFPVLEATVEMTGYALPVGSTITAGATVNGPAGAASGSVTATDSTVTSNAPPAATVVGGK